MSGRAWVFAATDPLREPLIGVYHDTRAWCLAHARPVAQPP